MSSGFPSQKMFVNSVLVSFPKSSRTLLVVAGKSLDSPEQEGTNGSKMDQTSAMDFSTFFFSAISPVGPQSIFGQFPENAIGLKGGGQKGGGETSRGEFPSADLLRQPSEVSKNGFRRAILARLNFACRYVLANFGRHLVAVWIGGVWNGHFPESEKYFSEAEISSKIPEIPQKERFSPNFRLRNLKIQSPKKCNSIPPAIPYPH